jgi:hypothetical protein
MENDPLQFLTALAALAASGAGGRAHLVAAVEAAAQRIGATPEQAAALNAQLLASPDAWRGVLESVSSAAVRAAVLREAYTQAYLDQRFDDGELQYLCDLAGLLHVPAEVAESMRAWVVQRQLSDAEWKHLSTLA